MMASRPTWNDLVERLNGQIVALRDRLTGLEAERDRLRARIAELEAVVAAQEELLVAYRLGKRPSEKALDVLQKHRAAAQPAKEKA